MTSLPSTIESLLWKTPSFPAGDAEAKKATVVIRIKREGKIHAEVLGHGFVVHAPDHRGKGGPIFYLISAAHVLISIAESMNVDSGLHLSLLWLQQ